MGYVVYVNAGFSRVKRDGNGRKKGIEWKNVQNCRIDMGMDHLGTKEFRDRVRLYAPEAGYQLQGYCLSDKSKPETWETDVTFVNSKKVDKGLLIKQTKVGVVYEFRGYGPSYDIRQGLYMRVQHPTETWMVSLGTGHLTDGDNMTFYPVRVNIDRLDP